LNPDDRIGIVDLQKYKFFANDKKTIYATISTDTESG
jgi:hypothetical protein